MVRILETLQVAQPPQLCQNLVDRHCEETKSTKQSIDHWFHKIASSTSSPRNDACRAVVQNRPFAVASLLLTTLAGCAISQPDAPVAQIDIQSDIGFTIVEEASISESMSGDYEQAQGLLQLGRLDEGIALLESVAVSAPSLSAPQIDLGIAYHRKGDLEAAESSLLRAIEINPDHPIAHNELGIVYRKTGRFEEAKQRYERALTIYPGYHYARRNLAVLCDIYLGDLDCALDNYEAYMETVPSDEEASMWIADIQQRIGR